ncbi:MAG: DUF177 domain-containing protein [Actinomycetota bacterium]|nr:DUF177 domain-containing protein [Actinomycetota bacterium]
MSNLVFSVAGILGQPGRRRDIVVAASVPEAGVALARLSDTPVEAELCAQSVVEGVLVTGRLLGSARADCARCARPVPLDIALELCELFVEPAHELADEAYELSGTDIDLEPVFRDVLTLALPLNPLCDAGCKGLCAYCGKDLNEGACSCRLESPDPRWAPLEELKVKLSQGASEG